MSNFTADCQQRVRMNRYIRGLSIIFALFGSSTFASETCDLQIGLPENSQREAIVQSPQDTMILDQIFYNGRIWAGKYYDVYGSEFFASDDWYSADITVNGKKFRDIRAKYDTYNDDLLASYYGKRVIILNRLNVDNFTLHMGDKEIIFTRIDSVSGVNGYCNILYNGGTSLLKKYRKKRAQFAIEARYDEFQQDDALYVVKAGKATQISKRRDLLKLLDDRHDEVRSFIRETSLRIDIKNPAGLIPLLRYYDNLEESGIL